jgi:competence protein ComEC
LRKLASAAFAFSAGIFAAQYLLPSGWLLPACLCALALGGCGFLTRENARLRVFLICGALAASLLYQWGYDALAVRPAQRLSGTEQDCDMTLCGDPQETDYGAKATVLLRIEGQRELRAVYYGERALLELAPGSTVHDRVELSDAAQIHDTDVTAFTSRGVFLLAYSRGTPVSGQGSAASLRWLPLRMNRALQGGIAALFDGDSAGALTAILTGDKTGLSVEASSDCSEAGLYHIMAVSGMHCAYLLAIVTFLAGRQRRRLTAAIALPLLAVYAALTGCSPSVVRACIMLAFLLLAPLLGRENDPPTALGCALALILIQNPYAAASISLQLSFAAMAGILWLTPKLLRPLEEKRVNPLARLAAVSAATTLGALLFTAPLTAVYFNTLVLIAPVSSLLCLWAAGAAFCLGLPAALAGLVWLPLGRVIALPVKGLLWYFLTAAHLLAKVPYHAVYFSNPYLKYWLAFVYLLFLLAWLLKPDTVRKYVLSAALALATLGLTVGLGTLRHSGGALDVTVLDVGQGASTIVASDGAYALIDCGSSNSWYDAGETAADSLSAMGCGTLDYLMLTHYDYDHVSGAETVMARLPVEKLIVPDTEDDSGLREVVLSAAAENGVEVAFVRSETALPLGEARVTVYPPLGAQNDNDRGLAYLCTAGDYDLLVTGDMSSGTEELLTETYRLPDIEALVVGHHGSKNSSSEEFLAAVKPETAVISVGQNSYGHPSDQTLRRLLNADAAIYRTDLQGSVHLTVN